MSKSSISQLLSLILLKLADRSDILASEHREVENAIVESCVNKVSGGLDIDAQVGYNPTSNVPITSPTQFVTKEWVENNAGGSTNDPTTDGAYLREKNGTAITWVLGVKSSDYSTAIGSITSDLSSKLNLSGSNANQDIDIGAFGLNAKHLKVNGTSGSGNIGFKHQSANITASTNETSLGANSSGRLVSKNDGNAIETLMYISDVLDVLNSTLTDKALSANQGRILNNKIVALENVINAGADADNVVNTFNELIQVMSNFPETSNVLLELNNRYTKSEVDLLLSGNGDLSSSGSYSNPSWITSLAWSKISGTPTTLSGYGITDAWRIGGNTLGVLNSIGSIDNYAVNLITNNIKTAEFIPIASSVTYLSFYSANSLTGQYNIVVKNNDNTTKTRLKLTTCNADNSDAISLYINGSNNYIDVLGSSGTSVFRMGSGSVTLYTGIMTSETSSGINIRSYAGNPTSTTTSHTGVTLGINGHGAGFSPTAGTYTNVRIGTNRGWTLSSTASYEGIALSSATITISGSGAINMLNMASNISSSGTGAINFININPSVTITGSAVLSAIYSNIASGTNMYNLNIVGSAVNYLAGNTSIGTTTNTASLTIGASTTSKASLRIMAGVAPTTPNDGDWWYDGTNVYFRVGSTTKMFTLV